MANYDPVAEARKILSEVYASPNPSYGDLLVVIERAIELLNEAKENKPHRILRQFFDENTKAAETYFAKAGNPEDHHSIGEQILSVNDRSTGIGRLEANLLLLDILGKHDVHIFQEEVETTND